MFRSKIIMAPGTASYRIFVKNKSNQDNMMCLFADLPGTYSTYPITLGWKVEPAGAGDTIQFDWTLDWGVFWKKTGAVPASMATFKDFWSYAANPGNGSNFNLELANGFIKLNAAQANGPPGTLYIDCAANIGQGVVSTGVTLNGAPVAAVNAFPNTLYTFTTHPTYWLAFGGFTQGKTVDISATNTPIRVQFQTGESDLYFVLGQDTKFTQVTAW